MRPLLTLLLALLLFPLSPAIAAPDDPDVEINTFSIVAADPETGDIGVAVATRLPAVGMYVPFVEAGVGAVSSQAIVNPQYGPQCLDLLRRGMPPEEVIAAVTTTDPRRADRQLSVVAPDGRAASYTGDANSAACGHRVGENYAVAGNLLASEDVLDAMARAFEQTEGRLGDRLMAALAAGDKAGGDRRGKQSAAILVKRPGAYFNDKLIDLRVDDSPQSIEELQRIYRVYMSTFLNLPGYRALAVGDRGADVRKLNTWLAEAGYGDAEALAKSGDEYTAATHAALEQALARDSVDVEITPAAAWRLEREARQRKESGQRQ